MKPFPWAEAMRIGLGILRLPPNAFWRMTPRELAAAISGLQGAVPQAPTRRAFDELLARFPDRTEKEKTNEL